MSSSKLVYYLLVVFFCFACSTVSSYLNTSSSTTKFKCPPQQSRALLHFKHNLFSISKSIDYSPYNSPCSDWLGAAGYHPIMMNWKTNTDCCDWNGVTCDDYTSDVIGLDLSCGMLQGTIHPNTSLFNLPHLQRLNLAFNDLMGSNIPPEIGRLSKSLTHLNISECVFVGKLPTNVTLLHNLVSLDLSYNEWMILEPLVLVDLLQNFTSLRKLSLAYLNINSSLPRYLNISYSSLELLDLTKTRLYGKLPGDIFNIQSLEILDLAGNSFTVTSQIPSETLLLPNLVSLDISYNNGLRFESHILNNLLNSSTLLRYLSLTFVNVSGVLPLHLSNSLSYLDLSYCNLMGSLPKSPLNLSNLAHLDLSNNKLNGNLPSWLFGGDVSFALPQLEYLSLANNQLGGQIDQSLIMKSTNLSHLDLSSNNFSVEWELGTLLSHLTNIDFLDLSYSGLSVSTSNAENISNPNIRYLYLNSCKLKEFPVSLQSMTYLEQLQLSNNEIPGDFFFEERDIGDGNKLELLDLSHNLITSLSKIQLYQLKSLNLESNQIQGPFPLSICNMSNLASLDLSDNRFDGEIPRCSENITDLELMDLGNNDFHGTIPNAYEGCESLTGLILKGNRLHGELPSSLTKCQSLKILDLGNNRFNGTLPHWLGNLQNLEALILRSNDFHGPIVVGSPFASLRVLDLSHNGFVGQLPQKYFENLKAMMSGLRSPNLEYIYFVGVYYDVYYSVVMDVKGHDLSFSKFSVDYMILDLSNNQFEGEIPDIIGNLTSLIVLDLSHNNLTGRIPLALGNLTNIESVDLSCNRLTGKIPQSLVGITNLEYLNLSENDLEGRIPEGNQFNTFNISWFEGNPKLCGLPLPNKCNEHSHDESEDEDEDEVDNGFTWRVVMMGYGCGTVVGLLMGYLMLSTGRPKWFNAIADAGENLIRTRRTKRRYVYIGK